MKTWPRNPLQARPPKGEAPPAKSAPTPTSDGASNGSRHIVSTKSLETFRKAMDKGYWAFEAGALALSAAESFQDLRANNLLEAGLRSGPQLAQGALRNLTRNRAHTAVLVAYFASKLIAKRGKNLAKMMPFLQNNPYVAVGADAVNLVSSPVQTLQTALEVMEKNPNHGLGAQIQVFDEDDKGRSDESSTQDPSKAKKHLISTDRWKKIGKPLNQLGWAFELSGLTAAVGSFLSSVKAHGLQMKALQNPALRSQLSAESLAMLPEVTRNVHRAQTFMLFTSIYFTLRIIGSRRKNFEKLIPGFKENPTVNGIMDALSLIVSPWRVGQALLTRERPANAFEDPKAAAPPSEQAPEVLEKDRDLVASKA